MTSWSLRLSSFLLIVVFYSCNLDKNQSLENDSVKNSTFFDLKNDKRGFPKNWIGNWKGELIIDNLEKDTTLQIPMELNIRASQHNGRWQWQLVYDGSPRDYELVAYKTDKGHFKMDEQNTIVLDQYLFGNTFISRYDVAGNLILVSNKLLGENMFFEVIFSRNDSVNITGGEGEVPQVKSYPISVYQHAILKKSQ